jgi:lysophospholipase L1-like esterase
MKNITFIAALALIICTFAPIKSEAQQNNSSAYYQQRATLFEKLSIDSTDIVFLGNSITDICEWSELLGDKRVKNRGIIGDTAQGVFERLDPILTGRPSAIFLLIGINDVSHNVAADSIVRCIAKISEKVAKDSPKTKLYIQSILPVNPIYGKFLVVTEKSGEVLKINQGLQKLCTDKGLQYIDVHSHLTGDDKVLLNPRLSNDGLHLLGEGYVIWKGVLEKYLVR